MLSREPLLVTLVKLVDLIPMPQEPEKRGRGRPKVCSDRIIVKALVIMVIRRLYTAYSLLAFLEQGTELTNQLKELLKADHGRFAVQRTWERRLGQLPETLPGLIGCLGRRLAALVKPWGNNGKAAALDSTPLRAKGGVWHQKDRERGLFRTRRLTRMPIGASRVTTAGGTAGNCTWAVRRVLRFGFRWRLMETLANVYDGTIAPHLQRELPLDVHYVLGDTHYNS
jgi:hypothetical protein